jgi:serine/threonine protein kinase/Tol biopolymer transport system component/tetratricopeptide (TPR) repeat protein
VSTEHTTNEEAIYYEALDKTPDQREAYLRAACGKDAGLLARVRVLLKAHEVRDNFLESAPWDPAVALDMPTLTEGPGTVIGRYKLLEKIGEGGTAVVYMAEQTEPIRRKVALKIIKLGMDTRQVIARFEAERQALALMDHPSIAKVLDAGATETGRPYFVMELVAGVAITEYCDKNSLSTKERLALFLQVCHAVQHAHQKGIIHRDIKPSNVMVTHHDGRPVPKVIDFGIAKATNQKLTEKTLFTRYAHIIGTPAYMSPEQAELSDLDVDTRSDIYSLGVLLYELLTGTTPFSEEELREAGYLEMQRVIREQEPVKPSTRIRTAHVAQPPSAGKSEGSPPRAGVLQGRSGDRSAYQQVRGDLDWIVMRTLEKDRARRYETASGLAEDIRRHLAHEPVVARGPSTAYRLRKFLRRHRVPTIAALAVVLLAGAAMAVLSRWNQNRLQLAEAEGFRDRGILSQAREQYAKAEREAALETIRPILGSKHVGPEAQLLQAGILVDNRRFDEVAVILQGLLQEGPEVAGAAHALLARLFWEREGLDAERVQEIEKHRRQAERLLPETAEAYFLRAMTAVTIREQLAALDQALRLDGKHYESRRLRAFTYYASRRYAPMSEDAAVMEALRDRDPIGYGLRAAALRELGRYKEAIADYDSALLRTPKEEPQYLDLTTQRLEALLRMGQYDEVVAAAPEASKRWPDRPVFQYYLFCARTALGEYEKADAVFRAIVQRTPTARNEFWFWATKYVFDTLEAGRSWHPPDHVPVGGAFLPLVEAEETYRGLSTKAHRVVTNGFSAQWSADGKKLAFSLGVQGYSGVALYDPATKETELLIVPGKDPRWSPDGKYIAFVRDCQALRLEELTALERKDQVRWPTDEEVWVMKADGTEPRRLARGGWPSWGKDSTLVYYHARLDNTLCSIPIAGSAVEPTRIMTCSSLSPSVSPDNQRVAYLENQSLKVEDLVSQAVVAEWRVPFDTWGGPAWSPAGKEVCLGAGSSAGDRTGLWIYPLDSNEPAKFLTSQIMAASWAPDGTKLVFALRPPYFELWTADLDPALSTVKALGPGQTLAEHWQDTLRLYTRRIEANPQDAYAYADRARYYDHLRERTTAHADMKRWSTIMIGGSSADTPRTLRHVLDTPFDCQLVFSAERPVNGIPVLSVAFGQKGRCEMKLFEIPMVVTSLVGLCFLTGLDAPPARADFTFGEPVNLKSVIPAIDPLHDGVDCLSADGLEMYIESDRSGGYGQYDLWVLKRTCVEADWGPPENVGPGVNGPKGDNVAAISADGLTLYFGSERSGGYGKGDLYMAIRASKSAPWGQAVNLGPDINTSAVEGVPCISPDGLELYFVSDRPGGYGQPDIYVARRGTTNDAWGKPVNLGPVVNSPYAEAEVSLSPDGLLLFFAGHWFVGAPRPGGYGGSDLWMTRRATISSSWQAPVNLGPLVNGPAHELGPRMSPDGSTLYFATYSAGAWDNWQASITPTIDFSGDSKVDAADLAILVTDWGKTSSACDIGPFAWGDGVVDEKDLGILMKPLVTPSPDATDVGCDVVLSWMLPSSTPACDVYLGTSQEAVTNASRTDSQGVLVSQGQTATTYQPTELLDLSRTYYWRVDFVSADAAPVIYKGPVLQFTTAALTYPIKNVTATASSAQAGSGPERTVDGSGLDKTDGHSTDQKDMWWSLPTAPHWIQYEFDRVYTLHELWVWNFNMMIEPVMGFGAKTVKIEYSTDGTTWTPLANVPEFAQAPGKAGYTANTMVSFAGVPAKFVKLTIEKNWGVAPQTGLSEVRFFAIQTAAIP